MEAQLFNESTPKKDTEKPICRTPTSKAKTKLDFNECNPKGHDNTISSICSKTVEQKFEDFEFELEDEFSIDVSCFL